MNRFFNLFKMSNTTLLLIIITSVVYFFQSIIFLGDTSATSIYYSGGILGIYMNLHNSYRFITAMFVHIGFTHFFMNMTTLYFTGPVVQSLYGKTKFLMIYLISGIVGNIFSVIFTPDVVSAGASTALFGLFGVLAMNGLQQRNQLVSTVGRSYWGVIGLNLFMNLSQPHVSLIGHIGGLVGGVICYFLLKPKYHDYY